MWKVKQVAFCGKGVNLDDWDDREWEPFAACPHPTNKDMSYLFLRRQVELRPQYVVDEVMKRVQNIQKVRDDTRTKTLKEVGQWLRDNHSSVLNKDAVNCCYILDKLQDVTMEGEMP